MRPLDNPLSLGATPSDAASSMKTPWIAKRRWIAELSLRIVTVVVFSAFVVSAISHWLAAPTRITLLLLVVANIFTTGLAIVARTPKQRDWRPTALVFSLCGSYGSLFYNLNPGINLVPETIGALLQISGIAWQLFAKTSLRRSFGILPANRGVVSRGAYRFIRHPMYLGYFVTDLGFLLTNFSIFNLLVHVAQLICQVGRITQEEQMLSKDERYRTYRSQVRFRLIPGIF